LLAGIVANRFLAVPFEKQSKRVYVQRALATLLIFASILLVVTAE
jgi:hypothetical protein